MYILYHNFNKIANAIFGDLIDTLVWEPSI